MWYPLDYSEWIGGQRKADFFTCFCLAGGYDLGSNLGPDALICGEVNRGYLLRR